MAVVEEPEKVWFLTQDQILMLMHQHLLRLSMES
jgi:hypothetical protein